MAGRPRTPTAVLELKGAFLKDPQRKKGRAREPKPNGPIGKAPASFRYPSCDAKTSKVLIALWDELVNMAPPKVLAKSDRWALEIACRLMNKARSGRIHGGEHSILRSYLMSMGLTPADRSRVQVAEDEKPEDEWSEFGSVQ